MTFSRTRLTSRKKSQPTLLASGRGCRSSTPSAYSWMTDNRSLDRTASNTSCGPLVATETVLLVNLRSMYLALMNSFLVVLQTHSDTRGQLTDVNTEGANAQRDAHMSLEAVGFCDDRLASMISLKL